MKNILFALIIVLTSSAQAKIQLDQTYSCDITDSNNADVPKGTSTKSSVTLNQLKLSGMILLNNPTHRIIEFYGPMEELAAFATPSDYITLVKRNGEIQGTIRVEPKSESEILLKIVLTLMGRAFDTQTGKQNYVFMNSAELYTLNCHRDL